MSAITLTPTRSANPLLDAVLTLARIDTLIIGDYWGVINERERQSEEQLKALLELLSIQDDV